jgi:hypothetical protein
VPLILPICVVTFSLNQALLPSWLSFHLPILLSVKQTCDDFATYWEAQWHYRRGTAPVDLDGDLDGEACEGWTEEIREDGQKISTNTFTNRWGYELWKGDLETGYYLRIFFNQTAPLFSTRSFATGTEAIKHANCYYGEACGLPRIGDFSRLTRR